MPPPRYLVRLLFIAITAIFSVQSRAEMAGSEPVRLLTIGNSFAENSLTYLPQLAKAAGKDLFIFRANLAGHSLQQHASYLQAFEANPADPKGSPYRSLSGDPNKKTGLKEILEGARWDYVTVQQASRLSFKPETYEPFAGILIAAIRKHAPQAKIVIHETWAYRADHSLLAREQITPETMYHRLHEAYGQLAAHYGIGIFPVGSAFHRASQTEEWKYVPDPSFDPASALADARPKPSGLHLGWKWSFNPKDAKEPDPRGGSFMLDGFHANKAGCYLGGLVFFHKLFPDVEVISFIPKELTPEEAESLQKIARETVEG